MTDRSLRPRLTRTFAVAALAVGIGLGAAACGDDEGTTTVEPSTTESDGPATTTTLLANQDAIDAMVETWTQAGFSEEQATCLVEQMNGLSSTMGDGSDLSAGNLNLIEQLMETCEIDDVDMSRLAGG